MHTVSSSSESEVEEDSNNEICNSSYSDHEATTVNHSVVFKCLKELRYQEILAEVLRKMILGETIPVDLRREPKINPFDSRAIAFVCKLKNRLVTL